MGWWVAVLISADFHPHRDAEVALELFVNTIPFGIRIGGFLRVVKRSHDNGTKHVHCLRIQKAELTEPRSLTTCTPKYVGIEWFDGLSRCSVESLQVKHKC